MRGRIAPETRGIASMNAESEAKIRRWRQYIEDCRKESQLLSPEGKLEMQSVIGSYERLIAMTQEPDR
jgi:hypothetical protein